MRVVIPQITWHSRDPVLSIDIDPTTLSEGQNGGGFYRMASGGADSQLLVSDDGEG
jgi:chromatin assembly factor 1 subunit B